MQQELFPMTSEYKDLPLEAFPTFRAKPTKQMVETVRKLGILQPIIIRGNQLVAGRRRVEAARIVGLKTIPSRIFPDYFAHEAVLALVENEQRRDNPLSDIESVETLLAQGKSETEISQETGIPKQKLQKILKLKDLLPDLRTAFEQGQMKHSTALLAAKKPKTTQERLLNILKTEGRLKVKDIQAVSKVSKQATFQKLPDSLFECLNEGWTAETKKKLEEAKRLAENNAKQEWLSQLAALIEKLG